VTREMLKKIMFNPLTVKGAIWRPQ